MSSHFDTPTDAEDAYYDAIDEADLEKMMAVWEDSPESTCLLPMRPMQSGIQAIRDLWQPMLDSKMRLNITINHLQWIEQGDIAIHLLEELVTLSETGERQPPIYAVNIDRRGKTGWRLLSHVNSPAPPPPGMIPPHQ
jgi:ketosteroid isomerase-like protein